MIILTSIVGEKFYDDVLYKNIDEIKTLSNNIKEFKLYIVTNISSDKISTLFEGRNDITIIEYPYLLWNYVDKLYYTFKLNKELNEDVLWIDINKVIVYENMIKYSTTGNKIKYNKLWTEDNNFLAGKTYWKPFNEISDINSCDVLKIMEQILFVPKGIASEEHLIDILKLKGTLSHQSAFIGFSYKNSNILTIGNGEGVILGYLIKKYNLPHSNFIL